MYTSRSRSGIHFAPTGALFVNDKPENAEGTHVYNHEASALFSTLRRVSDQKRPKRMATWLAAGLAIISLALLLVVVAQAVELYAEGWRMDMGSFPAWMSGFGAIFTAIAAVAAVLAFRGAEKERRAVALAREAKSLDDEIAQARLIVVEFMDVEPPRPMAVTNHSNAPIFDLKVEDQSPVDNRVRVQSAVDHLVSLTWTQLGPKQQTEGGFVPAFYIEATYESKRNYIQHITFSFTDARGARWQRVGTGQPVRLLQNP